MFYLGEHKKDTNFEQAYLLLHTVNNGIQYIRLLHKTSSFNLIIFFWARDHFKQSLCVVIERTRF